MENTIYWHDRPVGIECAGRITWFTSAPAEAIEVYGLHAHAEVKAVTVGSDIARNLLKVTN